MKKVHYNRLKVVLAEKGVTNKKLAQALQVAQSTVSHWCTNDMQPSIETLFHIAGYLKVEARDLLVLIKE